MYELRERLKQFEPQLHQTLERCWDIALNEWIPAMGIKNDSYNSYPHLRNLENYLTRLILQYEKQNPDQSLLNPVELYVMLSSILFHDIGRLIDPPDGHAEGSYRLLIDQAAELGLHSPELARTIARICRAHDYCPDEYREWAKQLTTVTIDPYGEIRERVLAALLTLVDHLDATHLRVLPLYMRAARPAKIVGAFREVVRGTQIDLEGQCIRVVLGDGFDSDKNKTDDDGTDGSLSYKMSSKLLSRFTSEEWPKAGLKVSDIFSSSFSRILDRISNWDDAYIDRNDLLTTFNRKHFSISPFLELVQSGALYIEIAESKKRTIEEIEIHLQDELGRLSYHRASKKQQIDSLLYRIRQILTTEEKRRSPKVGDSPIEKKYCDQMSLLLDLEVFTKYPDPTSDKIEKWPRGILLATIMKDTETNSNALNEIVDTLSGIGLPIRKWLLEYREKLYDAYGNETFEPIFTKEYLKHVFDGMYRLSTEVFPHGPFTYETLASEVRDPDVQRIKRAVKRLTIITDGRLCDNECLIEIWTSDNQWSCNKKKMNPNDIPPLNRLFPGESDAAYIIVNAKKKIGLNR